MIYSSVAVANSYLFLHFNETPHVEMNISRLNMLTFLTQCSYHIATQNEHEHLIDELVIVGDYFPIYESIHRSFDNTNYDASITSYGKIFDYVNQRKITPFINSADKEYCFVKSIHEQFFDIENNNIEELLTKEGSPYDLAYKNECIFINEYFLNPTSYKNDLIKTVK